MKYDGKALLEMCDVFVGSGGTMTAEAAFMGVPSVHMGIFGKEPHSYLNFSTIARKLLDIWHVCIYGHSYHYDFF